MEINLEDGKEDDNPNDDTVFISLLDEGVPGYIKLVGGVPG